MCEANCKRKHTAIWMWFPESGWAKGSSNSGGLSNIFTSSHYHLTSSHLHILNLTSSHLLIFTSSHPHILASSHLCIFTSSHLHILASSHLCIFTSSHLHILTSSHLHTLTSSHLLIFTYSHLHILISTHLLIFTSSHPYMYTSSHLHIFTSLHLHIRTSSHLLLLTSTQNEHIHMISSNILMNIFMQVFGVCKSYHYITHLSTYAPTPSTRSRANHRLLFFFLCVGGGCVCVLLYTRRHVISHVAAMFGATNAYAVTTNMLSDAEASSLDELWGFGSWTAVFKCCATVLCPTHYSLNQAKYVPPTGAAATSFDSCSNISWWARHQLFISARAVVSFFTSRLLIMAW